MWTRNKIAALTATIAILARGHISRAILPSYEANVKAWDDIQYFTPNEFASSDDPSSGLRMDLNFVGILDQIRHSLGKPIIINSGYRTFAHNERIGGVANSAHTKGLAADIHCPDLNYMAELVGLLKEQSITRIGQYHTKRGNYFVHCDIDTSKMYQGGWAYDNWGGGTGRKISNLV